MAELILSLKNRELQRLPITKSEITIGRDVTNDMQIDNTGISRYHARIVYFENRFYVMDDGSSNGTFVNGNEIQQYELQDGDLIQIAKYQIKFSMHTSSLPKQSAPSLGGGGAMTESTVLYSTTEMMQMLEAEEKQKQQEVTGLHTRMAGFSHQRSNIPIDEESSSSWGKILLTLLLLGGAVALGFFAVMHYLKAQ